MNNQKSVNQLLQEWKSHRPQYNPFCEDGILIQSEWDKSIVKIGFLLKETYNHFTKISGPLGPGGTSGTFWRRMRMWTYIIEEVLSDKTPSFNDVYSVKEQQNRSIAYINIKKYAEKSEHENEAYSDDYNVAEYAKNDSVFIYKQIKQINPDILVCCDTFKFCHYIFPEIQKISEKVYKHENLLLVDFGHPSQRKSYQSNYNDLMTILETYKKSI